MVNRLIKYVASWVSRLFKKKLVQKSLKRIAEDYFTDNPEEKDHVMKAYFAYHTNHFSENPGAHNFPNTRRSSERFWCGRSRESVRWDNFPAECQKRPEEVPYSIEDVINKEIDLFESLAKKAETEVPNLLRKMKMSGKTLAILHHTYGYDPETTGNFADICEKDMIEYEKEMELERSRSKKVVVKEIVSVTK